MDMSGPNSFSQRNHALHNEEVCELLSSEPKFNEWVVTSAFYAALHFVQSKVFPIHDGKAVYKNVSSYCLGLKQRNRMSKHKATLAICQTELPDIAAEYQWLLSASMTARYQRYHIRDEVAATARKYLLAVKAAC